MISEGSAATGCGAHDWQTCTCEGTACVPPGGSAASDQSEGPKPWEARIVYRLGCGCRASMSFYTSDVWRLVHRCKRHLSGVVPVRSMRRV